MRRPAAPARLRHLALAVALAGMLAGPFSQAAARPGASPSPTASPAMKQVIERLPDDIYLRRDDAAVQPLAMQALDADFEGLLLGAPRRVELARHPTVQALVLNGRAQARATALPWASNGIVVATDVVRGDVIAGPAVARPADKTYASDRPKAPGPRAAGAVAPASAVGVQWIELSALPGWQARSARLALRLVDFDQVTEPVFTDVIGPERVEDAMSPAQAQARLDALARPQSPLLADERPTLAPPAQPGIAAAAGATRGAVRPLQLAMKIELTRPMLVARPPRPSAGSDRVPAAVVRLTLLVVVKHDARPHLVPLDLPVPATRELRAGEAVDLSAVIDLNRALPPGPWQQGAQLYVFAGRHLSGPHAL